MPEYATVGDYAAAFGEPVPDEVATYLPYAADLVASAIRNDLYQVNEDGTPTRPSLLDAVRRATLTQVKYWVDNGVDPMKGSAGISAPVVSSSIGSGSITRDATAMASADAEKRMSANRLIDPAFMILRNAGLGSAAVGLW